MTEIMFQSPAPGGRAGAPGTGAAVASGGSPVAGAPGAPRGFVIEVSADSASWTTVAEAAGTGPSTTVTFVPVSTKFVRLRLTTTAADAPAWSLQNFRIYSIR